MMANTTQGSQPDVMVGEMAGMPVAHARVDGELVIHRLSKGWTRCTGVLRTYLIGAPLTVWVHPDDVQTVLWMRELAYESPASSVVRIGVAPEWRALRLTLGQWVDGQASLRARAVDGELPEHRWWRLSERRDLPPVPHAFYVVSDPR